MVAKATPKHLCGDEAAPRSGWEVNPHIRVWIDGVHGWDGAGLKPCTPARQPTEGGGARAELKWAPGPRGVGVGPR